MLLFIMLVFILIIMLVVRCCTANKTKSTLLVVLSYLESILLHDLMFDSYAAWIEQASEFLKKSNPGQRYWSFKNGLPFAMGTNFYWS